MANNAVTVSAVVVAVVVVVVVVVVVAAAACAANKCVQHCATSSTGSPGVISNCDAD